jgi:Domain of unknown function (DUF1707)
MAYDPNIRASDADRDRVANLLREHHAAGRLTPEEFSERLDSAFAAKTVGEIDRLLRDLPGIDLYRLPDAQLTRQPRQSQPRRHGDAWRAAWGSWVSCVVIFFVIWALTGHGYLWPLWIVGPWGAILLGRWVTGSHPQGGPKSVQGSRGQDPGQLPRGDEDLPGRPGG